LVYKNNRADVERRAKALDQLEVRMNKLRAAEVKEHTANVENYEKRHAENPSATFSIGVDNQLRDARLAFEELEVALNRAPNDSELRDCVKRFKQAVKGTVFAPPRVDVALRENSKVARYLDASGERINELINMGWSEIHIDSARKLFKLFRKPEVEDQQPTLCRAFKEAA
jgi:integrase